MAYRMIGVLTSAGAYGPGLEDAPSALRRTGFLDRAAADIVDSGDLPGAVFTPDPTNHNAQNLRSVVDVASSVRDAVAQVHNDGNIPLIIGGDCTITLGVVAGVQRRHPDAVLAYFDGDTDLSTPETTRSGILDAMGIAHLLAINGTVSDLTTLGDHTPPLTGDRISLIGYEESDLTEREARVLEQHRVHCFSADELRFDVEGTLPRMDAALGEGPRVVHFDVDAVDSTDLPLAEYPHFNTGVSLDTAARILEHLCDTSNLTAVVVTEANPRKDPGGVHMQRLSHIIAAALPIV